MIWTKSLKLCNKTIENFKKKTKDLNKETEKENESYNFLKEEGTTSLSKRRNSLNSKRWTKNWLSSYVHLKSKFETTWMKRIERWSNWKFACLCNKIQKSENWRWWVISKACYTNIEKSQNQREAIKKTLLIKLNSQDPSVFWTAFPAQQGQL